MHTLIFVLLLGAVLTACGGDGASTSTGTASAGGGGASTSASSSKGGQGGSGAGTGGSAPFVCPSECTECFTYDDGSHLCIITGCKDGCTCPEGLECSVRCSEEEDSCRGPIDCAKATSCGVDCTSTALATGACLEGV